MQPSLGVSLTEQEKEDVVEGKTEEEFVREYELENDQGSLYLIQKRMGDVNCVVWDAALLLAKYLEKRCLNNDNFLMGKKIIELGSGLGCVGLVASFYGGHVTMTDLPEALNLLKLNLAKNNPLIKPGRGSVRVAMLDWNGNSQLEPCDVILASDCVYYEQSISGLVKTLTNLSTPSTEIYLSQENRTHSDIQTRIWDKFLEETRKFFQVNVIPPREQHEEFRAADIFLLKLTKLST